MYAKRYFDLKKNHFILSEIGIICSLLFIIAATNINLGTETNSKIPDQQPVEPDTLLVLPPITPPEKVAPKKPMVFIVKPEDEILDDEIPEFPEFEDAYEKILTPPEQLPDEEEEEAVEFLPQMPTIIGGQQSLYSKIKYPKIAQDLGIEGRVLVQFIIDKKGNVTEPEIIRSVHPKLDEEVLRVIKLVKFSPGVQNGVLVRVKMVQMVNFQLKR